MTPASHEVRAFTALYPASCPRPSPSRIDSGHGFPSRNRGLLSSAKTPKTGTPKPIVDNCLTPAAATFLAWRPKVHPPEMGSMNQQRYARVHGRHHRLWAHGI